MIYLSLKCSTIALHRKLASEYPVFWITWSRSLPTAHVRLFPVLSTVLMTLPPTGLVLYGHLYFLYSMWPLELVLVI